MKGFTVCAFIAVLVGGLAVPQDLASKWEAFKAEHGKQYSGDEDAKRMQRFIERLAEIKAHNIRFAAGKESFSRQLSRYSDLTDEELNDQVFGSKLVGNETLLTWNDSDVHSLGRRTEIERSLPSKYDAEQMNDVTPVKSEEHCCADYAFAAVALLEAHIKRWKHETLDLSEQEVIDCTYKKYAENTENLGCRCGYPSYALEYVIEHGIATESDYPYTSGAINDNGVCENNKPRADLIVTDLKLHHIKVEDEDSLRQLLFTAGPFIATLGFLEKHKASFVDLKDGIYDVPDGHNVFPNVFVLIVGYGEEDGKLFWRFKNSWGYKWGACGYGKIARGKNMGNILQSGVYALSSDGRNIQSGKY